MSETPLRPISNQTCPALPIVTQRWSLILQQEKLLTLAVSDYIDRIVDGRGLRQRVITQPRPGADILGFLKPWLLLILEFAKGMEERFWFPVSAAIID